MNEYERRIQNSITKLEDHYWNHLSDEVLQDQVYNLALEYVAENAGDYYIALPGILLPAFS